ncbi:SH3 domain-containing protein [Streptomyces boluensis]|uniref:SH3 domain-containing protein n=1 Tax=Streptomyces boluensis TaxID=1775135 RepID=A0A964UMY7_9ACTN|nr:SH3 domain-containing protein [Streptomyces boluensis]NBE52099.1 SH3 domain-containing protein [Streptomyces boluensis]
MRFTGVKKALAGFAVTAATLGAVAATTGSAQASAPTAVQQVQAHVCTVNGDGVKFRAGPGLEYPVLGIVNRGHNMDLIGTQGDWVQGDLWGGRTGVWIHTEYLDNC